MDIAAVVVVLLHDQLRAVHMVHPGGDVGHIVIGAFAGDGVDQHRALHIHAAEKADGLVHPGADPVGRALFIDLEIGLAEHIGGVLEAQMADQIAVEMLRRGVFDALVQALHRHFLGGHIDDKICRQALGAVVEPLDDVAVHQSRHAHGLALIVDLGIVVLHLELADHVAELAQLAVAQAGGAVAVQHGDLVKGQLVHFLGKVARFHRQELLIGPRPQQHRREDRAHQRHRDQGDHNVKRDPALLAHELEIALCPVALKTGGDNRHHAVDNAQGKGEGVKLRRFQINRRQRHVKINSAEDQRDQKVDQRAPQRRLDRFGRALLLGLGLILLPGRVAAEVKSAEGAPGAEGRFAAAKGAGIEMDLHSRSSLS